MLGKPGLRLFGGMDRSPILHKIASDIKRHIFRCVTGPVVFLLFKVGRQDFSKISFIKYSAFTIV